MLKNQKLKSLLLITIVLLIIPTIFFSVDVFLASANKPPIFAVKTIMYKDGGTIEYRGLGYKVTDYNQMGDEGRKDVVFISKFIQIDKSKSRH